MSKRDHFRRLQHKRYSSGAYRNPYFQNKKQPLRIWLLLIGVGSFLVMGIVIFFLTFSAFSLKEISLIGISTISRKELEQQLNAYFIKPHGWIFRQTNRFLFSKKKFEQNLLDRFSFEKLIVEKKGKIIFITVKERATEFLWLTDNQAFVADRKGIVIRKLSDEEQSKSEMLTRFPRLVDRSNVPVVIGSALLNPKQLESIFQFHERLKTISISFTETQIDQLAGKWVGVVTKEGYRILFDPSADVEEQFVRLRTILQDTIKNLNTLEYIDLRFGDRVYFK